ncbi:unnamed protein product [Rhizophagus irregularis]|nr:unnamed protein product [Rhizophagus irregularis]
MEFFFTKLSFSLSRPISSPFSSQILTVLLDHFEGDILTVLSDFLAMVKPFLFRFFQISFACGILTSFFSGLL